MAQRSIHLRMRTTKRHWYALGGFANSALFRRHNGRGWMYYISTGHTC